MVIELNWKTGFEIELTAPVGKSREDLARALAQKHSGSVQRFFHPQSEPSKVPGQPTFENLTLGFHWLDTDGQKIASFVDDLTLQADFNKRQAPKPCWYRIIADDARLLRLVVRHCEAASSSDKVLEPLADLFGTELLPHESGMSRVMDDRGASVAICAPLPGERERPCEIVTAPIMAGHQEKLSQLLDEAVAQKFAVPVEGATHVHFDATPLLSAPVIAKLVSLFAKFGAELKQLVGVNTDCVRLGAWPNSLVKLTASEKFQTLGWPEAREAMAGLALSKYCDYNLLNIANENKLKHTFEVRVLPSTLDATQILQATSLFEALLAWCCVTASQSESLPDTLAMLINQAPGSKSTSSHWQRQIAARNKLVITSFS
ncbi:amidoligase family protein [Sphingorhabdus sp. M41]|uniref:amidoligase family protein n=1 Tax=Sphingorhabdus sp. M41 TaxID=1806885 RepID=UPI00078CED39|nr:amidoligase family protein [Sphingorhabdus sp. M41]AMO72088.1 hypothetical protein AZE99_09740 [Sphingorhabdus sp. M41]